MRGGLSTIQQTLTPEAASVLNQSIAEAGRRNHGQTTPLHVAATLLASPSGFLRQACIRSHPNSSHPLQCRALELCFSVALERLPTAQNASPGTEPPISNALMAALKRAQAHQRRGCPEQQQQPLLAVKVELEQLIISILDDPSVSRVMREASFSSPAVKATIEQSLNSTTGNVNPGPLTTGFRPNPSLMPIPMSIPNRNLYLNPKLQQGAPGAQGQQRSDEVKRLIDILMRPKKKNPILVGDTEPEAVVKELLKRIEKGELGESPLKNVQVIKIEEDFVSDKMQLPSKINELGGLIENQIGDENGSGSIILSLGDLNWLVEQPTSFGVPNSGGTAVQQLVVSEVGRTAVAEMGKLLGRFGEGGSAAGAGKLWLIGTATCETYLRCQVYHPSMENDWDLQAVPIASRSPLPEMFPRLSSAGNFGSSSDFVNPLKTLPTAASPLTRRVAENSDPARKMGFCSQCSQKYEQELAKLVPEEFERSTSEVISEAANSPLPQWLQNAKVGNVNVKITTDQSQVKDRELLYKKKSQLQKKWSETCLRLHPNYQHNLNSERTAPTALSMTGLYNSRLLMLQPSQAKLQPTTNIVESLQLNSNQLATESLDFTRTSPGHVRTDLVLGRTEVAETTTQSTAQEEHLKDFLGCISFPPQDKSTFECIKFAYAFDTDSFKKLLNGLMEKAWWQAEAASAVTTTTTRCRLGNGKRCGAGSRGDIWLLFTGPDRVGKKKMASVLAEHVCGTSPIMVRLGSQCDDKESDTDTNMRGKTALDRIADAIRQNPFSVIMLEDIDEANMLIRGSIKRAMERGRLVDSHGREISLGNVIFILAGNWSTIKDSGNGNLHDEKKLACMERGGWQLRLTIGEKSGKRRANWLHDEDRPTRHRKEMGFGLSFDLNLAADAEDDGIDGSNNTSDLTIDHEDEPRLENRRLAVTSVPLELFSSVDDTIVFKPVDYNAVRSEIDKTISNKFSSIIEDTISVEVDNDALEKILGGVWHGDTSLTEWTEKVLDPSFKQLKARLPASMLASSGESMAVRLEMITDSEGGDERDWLPRKINVMVD